MRTPLLILVVLANATPMRASRHRTFPDVFAHRLTLGADGNIWFTDGESVGRLTPNGIVTRFPTGLNNLRGIVLGPDGAVWFAHQSSANGTGGGLARISTTGALSILPRVVDALPNDVVVGGDGCLWASELQGEIWRLCLATEAPQVVRFFVGGHPDRLTRGGDGNIWFTDPGANAVRRITPLGAVTTHRTGLSPGARPGPIATDGDGDLLFIETGISSLGRLRMSTGLITEISLEGRYPAGFRARDIAQGPGGTVYFTVASPDCRSEAGGFLGFVVGAVTLNAAPLPADATPGRLTNGAAEDVWITDSCKLQVYRFAAGREPLEYFPLAPCRAADTRVGSEGPLPAFGHRLFALSETCGIPRGAKALAANVTVTVSEAAGDLRIVAANLQPNDTTVLSFRAGGTRANSAQIGLSPDGGVIVHNASPGGAHVVLDVSGYWR